MLGKGILIVDDEESILNALARELFYWLNQKGLILYKARSGQEALDFLKESHKKVLLLISDLKMQGMAGDELIALARNSFPEIQSILMTGYTEMEAVSRAVSAGISAFIPKPWDTNHLVAQIERVLDLKNEVVRLEGEKAQIRYQLEQMGEAQQQLFQRDLPSDSKYQIHLTYKPVVNHFCSGDFYELIPLSEDRLVLLLGDVSGHGAGAAFITGILHTLISQESGLIANDNFSPSLFLTRLNALVCAQFSRIPSQTISITVALLDRARGVLSLSNAGGFPLMRVRKGFCEPFYIQGIPLGFAEKAQYLTAETDLATDDLLVLMTDGLVDVGAESGMIDGMTVKTVLEDLSTQDEYNERVVDAFLEFFPGKVFKDDVTLITVRVR